MPARTRKTHKDTARGVGVITKNSIDLNLTESPCYGYSRGYCMVLRTKDKNCGTAKCPFYKPQGCKDWVRVEDEQGKNLVPIEEWRKTWMRYLHI